MCPNVKRLIKKAEQKKSFGIEPENILNILNDFKTRSEIAKQLNLDIKDRSTNWKLWATLKELMYQNKIIKLKLKQRRDVFFLRKDEWENMSKTDKQNILRHYELMGVKNENIKKEIVTKNK